MNILEAQVAVRNFITIRTKIDTWDLDIPASLYSPTSTNNEPGSSAIALPIQNLVNKRSGINLIETSVTFPYRITYRFANDLPYHSLPFDGLAGILGSLHLYSLLQSPDPNFKSFKPAEVEDSITVSKVSQQDGDWLVELNFAFEAVFNTTDFPNISTIQPTDYYSIGNPPSLAEITIRINRAKPNFVESDGSTYILDSTINITK